MRRRAADNAIDALIEMNKLLTMPTRSGKSSPKGKTAAQGAERRAQRSDGYRQARDEYAEIRELRAKNWIAAHIRERRYELDLTQRDVAEAAGTAHSFISRLERGQHMPTIPVLKRVLRGLGRGSP